MSLIPPSGLGIVPPIGLGAGPLSALAPSAVASFGAGVQSLFNGGGLVILKRELSIAELNAINVTPVTLLTPQAGFQAMPFIFYCESNTRAAGMATAPSLRLHYANQLAIANALVTLGAINANAVDRYQLTFGTVVGAGSYTVGLSPPAANATAQPLVIIGNLAMVGAAGSRNTITAGAMIVPAQAVP